LLITSLGLLSSLALHKCWLKSNNEMGYLYGNHLLKSNILKLSDNIMENNGIIVYTHNNLPLGFGNSTKNLLDLKSLDLQSIIIINQADLGIYLRNENYLS
jgi:60S ribosome subunit biogenesis protein NIP7